MITRAQRLHWPISDPAGADESKKPEVFRSARDEVEKRLTAFGKEQGLI